MANSFFTDIEDVLKVQIGSGETTACKRVTQHVELVQQSYHKETRLVDILRGVMAQNGKSLVFCATKRMTDQLSRNLQRQGFLAKAIHGDKDQQERDRVLNDFKTGACRVMVATDVASRGIHVNDISYVINFDFPNNIEDYVHRIGRTGRAGTYGTAYTFFSKKTDFKKARSLVRCLEEAGQVVPTELRQIAAASHPAGSRFRGRGRGGREKRDWGGRDERDQDRDRGRERRDKCHRLGDESANLGSYQVASGDQKYGTHTKGLTTNECKVHISGGLETGSGEPLVLNYPKYY